jgi:hypothetical protein
MDGIAMASAIETTPSSSTAPTVGGEVAPTAWQLVALTRPARLGARGACSAAARLWLEWTLQVTGQALERTLDRPVTIEIPADDPEGGAAPVFGVAFAHPACAGEGLIVLDAPLGRAIVDALETDFANLRGNGHLSEAELGLLEYTTLACVDHVLRDGVPAASHGFALRAFLGRSELQERLKDNPLTPGVLNVRIAGREGRVRLYLPGWEAGDLTAAAAAGLTPPVVSAADLQTTITLRLALPPVTIPPGEVERLQPGDLLLLGATELKNMPECRLVTSTGWSVASATIVRHTPTVLSVRCGAFEPQARDAVAVALAAGQQVITPVAGQLPLRIGQLQRWRSDAALDLPLDLAAPVELQVDGRPVGEAELVRVDGEVGLRLLGRKNPGAPAARR